MTPADPEPQADRPRLDAPQRRVLGVLVEKAKTTPAGYPMTVNAIVTACNQKNNRDPVTAYDDIDVERALDQLRTMGAVAEIDWMGRAAKYKHLAYDWLGVSRVELAVLGELLLRGAQTLGDLRGRAARMEPIADVAELKPVVDSLVERGLVVELTPPGRGQLVTHGLYTAPELDEQRRLHGSGAGRAESPGAAGAPPSRPTPAPEAPDLVERVAALESEVARLRTELDAWRAAAAAPRPGDPADD